MNKYADERERQTEDIGLAWQRLADLVAAQRRTNITYRDDELVTTAGRVAELSARLAGGEYRPAYNGWPNRETWNASLWIDNDQGTYEAARELIRDAMAGADYDTRGTYDRDQNRRYLVQVAAEALKDWYSETFEPTDTAGPLADAWTYAVAVADWPAIVDGIAEGMDPAPWKGYHE